MNKYIDHAKANFRPLEYSVQAFVLIMTCFILVFPSVAFSDCTLSSLIGDANGDGQITPGDALEIFWSSIRGDWQTMDNYCCLDANKDAVVTPGDALMVFWYSIYQQPVEGVTGHTGESCEINTAPTASFTVDPISGTTLTTFNVDASESSDNEDPSSALQAHWDWDNNGYYDTGWSTTKTASHQYTSANIYTIKLEVKDTGGLTGTVTHQVSVDFARCGTVTDVDSNTYQTIQIGDQCWMAENLKVTHYRNGDPIPEATGNSQWAGLSTGAYCNYDNNANNAATYGRLYNLYAVIDGREIAPAGWHVPTDEEWQTLVDYLGGSSVAGGKMKTTGTIEGGDGLWYEPNTGGTNESGFSALPAGFRDNDGYFYSLGDGTFFWSATESDSSDAWYRFLYNAISDVYRNYMSKDNGNGLSVRCLRD